MKSKTKNQIPKIQIKNEKFQNIFGFLVCIFGF